MLKLISALALALCLAGPALADDWGKDKDNDNGPVGAVPEPTALLTFGAGAIGVAWVLRRRNRS